MISSFSTQTRFWKRREPLTVGDFISRPAIVKAAEGIGTLEGLNILEAGCGDGYLARMLIEEGASKVIALDKEQKMLDLAKDQTPHQRIEYRLADITKTGLESGSQDIVICHSVLLYNNAETVKSFLKEADRVLSPTGRLVIGNPHPYLFEQGSPAFGDFSIKDNWPTCWIHLMPLSPEKHKMVYSDINGKRFVSEVFGLSTSDLFNASEGTQLNLRHLNEIRFPRELLSKSHYWGDSFDYPAYLHMVFAKGPK